MEPAGQAPEARALSASAAFQALADEHLDDAYRLARVILHDEADARDATHDAFVRAWRSWSSLRDPARFEAWFDRAVPEGPPYWTHTLEGDDDMPAHVKAALLGPSLTLPIGSGRPMLGTWQGIYLCEHRDRGGPRRLVASAWDGSG